MDSVLLFVASFATAALAIGGLRPLASRVGLVDRPSLRKRHEGEIPVVGGLAVLTGFILAMVLGREPSAPFVAFLFGGLVLVMVGVADDMLDLPARFRLVFQLVAGLILALGGGVMVTDLGALVGPGGVVALGAFALPFTLLCVAGGVNAFNMADGLDGLAGGLALVALLAMALAAGVAGAEAAAQTVLMLVAAVLGFLWFNLRTPWRARASVFLGDSGSMFIGFAVTWFLLTLAQGEQRAFSPVTALWLVAVPLFDMAAVMLRRIAQRRSPFSADRHHLHHLMLAAGFSPGQAVARLLAAAALLAGTGLGGHWAGVPEHLMFLGFLALFAGYVRVTARAWKTLRFLGRPVCRRAGADRRATSGLTRAAAIPDRRGLADRRRAGLRAVQAHRASAARQPAATAAVWRGVSGLRNPAE